MEEEPRAYGRILIFDQRTDRFAFLRAIGEAEAGGTGLHVWEPGQAWIDRAPLVFRQSTPWGHLIDRDADRLIGLALKLGVKKIAVGRQGRRGQHIDLCGGPLREAIALAFQPCCECAGGFFCQRHRRLLFERTEKKSEHDNDRHRMDR